MNATQTAQATETVTPKRRKGGRRFSKFEKQLFATFERTQGREAVREAIALIRGEKESESNMEWHGSRARFGNLVRDLDRLLGTHGIEVIEPRNACGGYGVEGYHGPRVTYLNAGGTYAATLCYVHGKARPWRIACWGDFVERYSR